MNLCEKIGSHLSATIKIDAWYMIHNVITLEDVEWTFSFRNNTIRFKYSVKADYIENYRITERVLLKLVKIL